MLLIINRSGLEFVADDITASSQGWQREVTVRWRGHKIRASIYRDSYDFQSRIHAEVWSPATLSWNRVRTLPGADRAEGLPGAYSLRHANDTAEARNKIYAATEHLVEELVAYAQTILEEG